MDRKVLNILGGHGPELGGGGGGKLAMVQNLGGGGQTAPNQCQIITFLTLKTDNIAKLRIN